MSDLLIRRFEADGCASEAVYSPCETYRYGLSRRWAEGSEILWIMLNPSTATEERNDPTIERCERRSRAMGGGAMRIANLFAFRATDPKDLKRAEHPIGPENDDLLLGWHKQADMTLAAWGVHGTWQDAQARILSQLSGPLHHLGLTKHGLPRHPLYVSYKTQPMLWTRS